jgi:biopolymer transport protein ExbD
MAKKKEEEVEMNLAAMLDMAFQILTFFILTFKPAPVEGQIQLRMPPPMPAVYIKDAKEKAGDNEANKNPVKALNTLPISVFGSATGKISQIAVGDAVTNEFGLGEKLKAAFGDSGAGFDQVIVQVGSSVNYESLMKVIGICTQQKLPNGERLSKLSFLELPGG